MGNTQNTKDTWNPSLYDNKHAFISKYGNDLIELLAPKDGEKILDLGCGTGDLAKTLVDFNANVVGVDKSENMVAQAKNKYPEMQFLVRDVTNLGYTNEFDAVFSNATLHWVKSPKQALSCIYESLQKDGRFVAEFGGKGNVQRITDGIIHQLKENDFSYRGEQFPWYYPSIGEYASLMEDVGFRVTFAQHYNRPTPLNDENGLRNWIKMFCSAFFEEVSEDEKDSLLTKVENHLKASLYIEGSWIADYKRIRVIGVKE